MARDVPTSSFTHRGRRIAYRAYGSGPRLVVLTHGLLMDGRMYTKLAPTLAARGHHVVCPDMLGHGAPHVSIFSYPILDIHLFR